MKWFLAAMVCLALISGCAEGTGGGASLTPSASASPTPSPSGTTFTNHAHHFTLTYDPAAFRVTHRSSGGQLVVRLSARDFKGGVVLNAIPMSAQFVQQSLAEWHKGKLRTGSGYDLLFGHWTYATYKADAAQWVTLNGVRGVRAELHKGAQKYLLYYLMHGDEVYALTAGAPANQWTAEAQTLDRVIQSFRVTK